MHNSVLLELVAKWEKEAVEPECQDGSPDAEIENAVNRGARAKASKCAEDLNLLIKLIG